MHGCVKEHKRGEREVSVYKRKKCVYVSVCGHMCTHKREVCMFVCARVHAQEKCVCVYVCTHK